MHIGDFKTGNVEKITPLPNIAFLIPVFNTKSEYLMEAIDSILDSNLKVHIFLVNDGSTIELPLFDPEFVSVISH